MIVAVKDKKGFLIARDTRLMLDDKPEDESINSNDLLFPAYDDETTVIGVQGDTRIGYFLKYLGGMLPSPKVALTIEFMVQRFVPHLYQELCKMHYATDNERMHFDCSILVARRNKAFLINQDSSVTEIGDEECVGPGSNYADGMLLMNKDLPALERIMQSYVMAAKHSYLVSTNIVVANTSNPSNWVIYDGDDAQNIVDHTFKSKLHD